MQRRSFIGGSASVVMAAAAFEAGAAAAPASAGGSDPAAFAARRRFADTRFGRIAYVEQGRGPVALFLHAWPLNSYQWRGVLGPLSDARRCVAPDFMSLGYTEVAEGQEITPATQAEMLVALLEALGAPRADLVANDSGGLVAQVFAAHHPEKVRSLLLTNCDVGKDNPPPAFVPLVKAAEAGVLARGFQQMLANVEAARAPAGLGGAFARPQDLSPETVAFYLAPLVATAKRQDELHRYTVALGHNDLETLQSDLARLSAPVRIVWAQGDTIFNPASPDLLDKTFPHSMGVRRVADAKLFFPEERPEVVIEEARKLWATVGKA